MSIRLCTDGFSFCIYDITTDSIVNELNIETDATLSLTANLRKLFKSNDFVNHAFDAVHIISTGKRFTMLPTELYNDSDKEELFYYNLSHKENEIILQNDAVTDDLLFLFGMDRAAHHLLSEHYPNITFHLQPALLHNYFRKEKYLESCNRMYLSFRTNAIDIYAYDERHKPLLINAFATGIIEDQLYYLLNIWKTLNFDQENDILYIYGEIEEKERMLNLLNKYIKRISFITPETNLDFKALL